jgi:hypothetical protein
LAITPPSPADRLRYVLVLEVAGTSRDSGEQRAEMEAIFATDGFGDALPSVLRAIPFTGGTYETLPRIG